MPCRVPRHSPCPDPRPKYNTRPGVQRRWHVLLTGAIQTLLGQSLISPPFRNSIASGGTRTRIGTTAGLRSRTSLISTAQTTRRPCAPRPVGPRTKIVPCLRRLHTHTNHSIALREKGSFNQVAAASEAVVVRGVAFCSSDPAFRIHSPGFPTCPRRTSVRASLRPRTPPCVALKPARCAPHPRPALAPTYLS